MSDCKIISRKKPVVVVSSLDSHRIITKPGHRTPPPKATPTRPDVLVGGKAPTDFSMGRQGAVVGKPPLVRAPKPPTIGTSTVSGRASGGGGLARPPMAPQLEPFVAQPPVQLRPAAPVDEDPVAKPPTAPAASSTPPPATPATPAPSK